MSTRFKILILLPVLLFSASIAVSQDVERNYPVRFLVTGAFEFGGDEVAKIFFTNGEDQSVNAGQGVTLSVGAQFQFPKMEKLLLRASAGIKYVTTQADNVHIRLTRVPLQFTGNFMVTDKIRLGAGIVTHTAVKFNSGGLGGDMTYKSNTGPVFEIAYRGVGVSYTSLRYTDTDNISYSANAIGVTLSGVFPSAKK